MVSLLGAFTKVTDHHVVFFLMSYGEIRVGARLQYVCKWCWLVKYFFFMQKVKQNHKSFPKFDLPTDWRIVWSYQSSSTWYLTTRRFGWQISFNTAIYCSLTVFEVRIEVSFSSMSLFTALIKVTHIWNTQVEWYIGFENVRFKTGPFEIRFWASPIRFQQTLTAKILRKVKSMWTKACCVYWGDDWRYWSHHLGGEMVLGTWGSSKSTFRMRNELHMF